MRLARLVEIAIELADFRRTGCSPTTRYTEALLEAFVQFPRSRASRGRAAGRLQTARVLGRDALADAVVKRRARHGTKDSPPHVLRVHPEMAAAIVEAEHADVAVAYPGACGSRVGRPRRERGVCVTHTSDEVDGIEHHFGEQPQRRKVGAGTVVVIDI